MEYRVNLVNGKAYWFRDEEAKKARRVIEHSLAIGAKVTSPLEYREHPGAKEVYEVEITPKYIVSIEIVNWEE